MFKQHLEMIGRNETPSKKAKFWQSYVRSLKGMHNTEPPYSRIPCAWNCHSICSLLALLYFTNVCVDRLRWYSCPWNTKNSSHMASIEQLQRAAIAEKHLWRTSNCFGTSHWRRLSLSSRSPWNIRLLAKANLLSPLQQTRYRIFSHTISYSETFRWTLAANAMNWSDPFLSSALLIVVLKASPLLINHSNNAQKQLDPHCLTSNQSSNIFQNKAFVLWWTIIFILFCVSVHVPV